MYKRQDYARGDALIIMDADLQHPPEKIPEMIHYWECGYDDVYAKRVSRKNESKLKAWCAETFYRLLQRSTKVNIYPNVGDFRLLDLSLIHISTTQVKMFTKKILKRQKQHDTIIVR